MSAVTFPDAGGDHIRLMEVDGELYPNVGGVEQANGIRASANAKARPDDILLCNYPKSACNADCLDKHPGALNGKREVSLFGLKCKRGTAPNISSAQQRCGLHISGMHDDCSLDPVVVVCKNQCQLPRGRLQSVAMRCLIGSLTMYRPVKVK
ncbi:hypothetical protein CHS0354_030681 [Potamilus streckersoni]|uniref:Uncharacterized protein n=1 Tax=Potamilus streckersoni TaxID=2493646 RepID=A0AAE0T186_9BIVA|nr:hypothetical protein CHS0354_030681 [Potamilus streckersoni]